MMDDLTFIRNPNKWPCWPILPVKRYVKNTYECGFVWNGSLTDDTVQPKVYLGNMFTFNSLTPEERAAIPVKEYPSLDSMLADGWMVD